MDNTKILYQSDTNNITIYHEVMNYCNEKYDLRFNTVSLELEIKIKNTNNNWSILNINSLLIELNQKGINISMSKLEILIKSEMITKYNPIEEYFESLPKWDGKNHINDLCTFIKTTDDTLFQYHFEKWLTRAVICALEKGKINKQCLVLYNIIQNSGKSTFLQFLIPRCMHNYYTEEISVDKDGLIALCKNLIVNSDELSIMSRSDINSLKAFISKNSVNARLPYARKAELMTRCCSFVASTNRIDFLNDETGSVRWLIFEVLSIDFNYSKNIDMDNVWAQAYYNAYYRENYNPQLTREDIEENEMRNEKYSFVSIEQEIIIENFEKSNTTSEFLTASEIRLVMENALGIKLDTVKIGKALIKLKYERIKHPKRQVYGYLIKRKI